jgi:hypothetical protein
MLLGTAKGGMGTGLHCMPVRYEKEGDAEGIGWLKGLILQLTHETKGGFERFGLFEATDPENLQVFEQSFEDVDKLEHEESDGKGSYTVTIRRDLPTRWMCRLFDA